MKTIIPVPDECMPTELHAMFNSEGCDLISLVEGEDALLRFRCVPSV